MDRELRDLERRQDLDGLERLEAKGVTSYFLDQVREHARRDFLRVLRVRAIYRAGIPILPSDTVVMVTYGGQPIPVSQRPRISTRVFLLGRHPGLGAGASVRVIRAGSEAILFYWWTGHTWTRYDIETNLRGQPRVVG